MWDLNFRTRSFFIFVGFGIILNLILNIIKWGLTKQTFSTWLSYAQIVMYIFYFIAILLIVGRRPWGWGLTIIPSLWMIFGYSGIVESLRKANQYGDTATIIVKYIELGVILLTIFYIMYNYIRDKKDIEGDWVFPYIFLSLTAIIYSGILLPLAAGMVETEIFIKGLIIMLAYIATIRFWEKR